MKRADPSKKIKRPYMKRLRKFSCAPFGLVQPLVRVVSLNECLTQERHRLPNVPVGRVLDLDGSQVIDFTGKG